ncbi:phospholipase B1, membrane-associated [Camelus ferus]|nr:phospholipase B1, membrane-associated [Camelus ferus]
MGLRPRTFLLGLLLLLGQGTNKGIGDNVPISDVGKHPGPYLSWRECIGRPTMAGGQGFVLMGQGWQTSKSLPFSCNPRKSGSEVPSNSVHSLRPSDIKFVAAIGDVETQSLAALLPSKSKEPPAERTTNQCLPPTSAYHISIPLSSRVPAAVCTLCSLSPCPCAQPASSLQAPARYPRHRAGCGTEDRPPQACMGVVTDVIRHFNPSVLQPVCAPVKAVVPYSGAEDLWIQAKELVRSLKENQQLDFQNDWKLINVFFGNTSQCHLCPSTQQQSHVASGMSRLTRTLDYLHQEVPKAFVNLVDLSEALGGSDWHQGTTLSPAAETCRCSEETSRLSKAVAQWSYQETWERLLASSKYNEQESFAVVFQPFFYERALPPPSGQQALQDPSRLALTLWNSMGHEEPGVSLPPPLCVSDVLSFTKTQRGDGKPIFRSSVLSFSVHRLKLADIKVIGALGDSLTAGNGAGSKPGNVLDVLTQYRGLSWSAGGDQNLSSVITLPSEYALFGVQGGLAPVLRVSAAPPGGGRELGRDSAAGDSRVRQGALFPRAVTLLFSLKEFEVGLGGVTTCLFLVFPDILREFNPSLKGFSVGTGKESSPRAFLNQAVAGARAEDLPVQARRLVDLMKNNTVHYSPENFVANIGKALDILHAEVPRAFVNLVKVLEIINLRELYQDKNVSCPRLILRNLCPCVLKFDDNSTELAALIEANKKYQERTHELVESGQYDTREDFTVVVQPFFEKVDMPKTPEGLPDSSFFAPDCFHFSSKAHAHAASALWNSMVWPYLSTYKNSVKAGNGIGSKPDDLSDVTTQYRGLSFSSGGDSYLEKVTTLPNILRKFNGNLTGYAVGTGEANDTNAFLNQAVSGAKAKYGIWGGGCQRVNFHEDWKVITVLIGGSDLCDYCTDSNLYSAANYFDHLRNALDILHREVPRALVNLVDFMSPSVMRQVFLGNPDKCPVQQASILCNCVLTPREGSQELARLEDVTQAYQSSMRELVESGRYDTREDFSVVLQPFFHSIQLPVLADGHLDMSFFAPDCLHPSQKFHSQLSRALWVNMLEPPGRKTDTLDLTVDIPLSCPTQNEPFLRTPRNSNYTYPTEPATENWGSDLLCAEWDPSNSVPTSVHELRPADIKVVAALGDSLTGDLPKSQSWGRHEGTGVQEEQAGSLMRREEMLETGVGIGGDGNLETITTLPNILKKFNPKILGFSTGTQEETAGLNVAVEGARAWDMPAQARDLVERMKNSPEAYSPREYLQHIQQALDIFYKELPRAFINVVEVMELVGLHQGQGGKCVMPLAAQSNCTCLRGSQENSPEMQKLKTVNWNFQSGLSRFSYQHEYLQREDFAVVAQPFFQNTLVPLNDRGGADLTFFSEDCFHFSERGHAEMAIALWNNMESPYLRTLRNSQLLQDQAEADSQVLSWALPVAAGGGLVVGVSAMMIWRALRGRQRENLPIDLNTMRF